MPDTAATWLPLLRRRPLDIAILGLVLIRMSHERPFLERAT
jgi:hypothetical protein